MRYCEIITIIAGFWQEEKLCIQEYAKNELQSKK